MQTTRETVKPIGWIFIYFLVELWCCEISSRYFHHCEMLSKFWGVLRKLLRVYKGQRFKVKQSLILKIPTEYYSLDEARRIYRPLGFYLDTRIGYSTTWTLPLELFTTWTILLELYHLNSTTWTFFTTWTLLGYFQPLTLTLSLEL